MKILFLTNKVPYPPKDGGAIATLGMIEGFANAGHSVTILAMNTMKHHVTPFEIPQYLTRKIIIHLVEVPARITFKGALRNLLFSKLPYNAERFIDKNFSEKLESLLNVQKYDIIQLEGLYVCPYISIIRKFSSAIVVYRSHNIEHEIWERTLLQTNGFKKIYLSILTARLQKFEIAAINKYDLLVPITRRDKLQLNKLGNTKPVLTIPAGFSDDNNDSSDMLFAMNLFFIGALDWTPNQEGLIWFLENCWPVVCDRHTKIVFKIAGRNAPDWFVEKLKQPNVEFLGEIDDAKEFFNENGIMLVPLLSGSGMRVKIIEGMFYKKAIVTTPVGCEGIEVENEKHIFVANTPEEFTNYVHRLISDRELVVEIGIKAFNFVADKFDNQKLSSKLAAFYNQHIL